MNFITQKKFLDSCLKTELEFDNCCEINNNFCCYIKTRENVLPDAAVVGKYRAHTTGSQSHGFLDSKVPFSPFGSAFQHEITVLVVDTKFRSFKTLVTTYLSIDNYDIIL